MKRSSSKPSPLPVPQHWSLASEFIGGFVCGLWLGYAIDNYASTNPWGILGGGVLGFIVGIWNVWKKFSPPSR